VTRGGALPPGAGTRTARRSACVCTLIAVAVLGVHFGGADLARPIFTDVRFYVSFAAQIADGGVPHRDYFDNKPQLAAVVAGGLERLGRASGVEPLVVVRVGFLVLAAVGGLLLFLVHRSLAGGECAAGLLGVIAYVGFTLPRALAEIGPLPKLLLGVLATASALLALRRRWGWAGATAALAALDWQVGGLAGIGVLAAALTERDRRWRCALRVLLGGVLVVLVVVALLAAAGALEPAWRQIVTSLLVKGEAAVGRGGARRWDRLARLVVAGCDGHLWLVAAAGVGAIVFPRWLLRTRGSPLLRLALPLAVFHYGILWFSALDFQGYGDLLALVYSLAFFAGVAGVEAFRRLRDAVSWLAPPGPVRERAVRAAPVVTVVAAALAVRLGLPRPDPLARQPVAVGIATLDEQRAIAAEIVRRVADRRTGFVGCAEYLYLTKLENRLPFVFWNRVAADNFRAPGDDGPAATLERIVRDADVDAIVCPVRSLRRTLVRSGAWERVVLGPQRGRARVFLFLRRSEGEEEPAR
jgi:hypothetical protein